MTIQDFLVNVNHTKGRGIYKPEAFVLHVMGGFLYGCDSWFANPSSMVSAHFGIGGNSKREIHQYVKLQDTAWHAGGNAEGSWSFLGHDKSDANPYTIGIELEGAYNGAPIHEDTIDEAAWFVSQLYIDRWLPVLDREHGIGHSEINQISRANCPGIPMDKFLQLVNSKLDRTTPGILPHGPWEDFKPIEVDTTPAWIKEVLPIQEKVINPIDKFFLYDIDTKEKLGEYLPGTELRIAKKYQDYYITNYSLAKRKKQGFLISEVEPKMETNLEEQITKLNEKIILIEKERDYYKDQFERLSETEYYQEYLKAKTFFDRLKSFIVSFLKK